MLLSTCFTQELFFRPMRLDLCGRNGAQLKIRASREP